MRQVSLDEEKSLHFYFIYFILFGTLILHECYSIQLTPVCIHMSCTLIMKVRPLFTPSLRQHLLEILGDKPSDSAEG